MSEIKISVPEIEGYENEIVLAAKSITSKMTASSDVDTSGNVGLEAEYFLANPHGEAHHLHQDGFQAKDFDLLAKWVADHCGEEVVPEMDPSMVEVHLKKGHTLDEVLQKTLSSVQSLINAADLKQLTVYPFGTNPSRQSKDDEQQLIEFIGNHPDPYYQFLLKQRDGVNLENLACAGIQYHYQETNGETAVNIYNALRQVVPVFAALSASSPFYRGVYSGYLSERIQSKKRLPLSGLPPLISNFNQYIKYLQQYLSLQGSAHTIQGAAPGYFLLRLPRLDIGTLEFCACDNNPDLELVIAMLDLYTRICRQVATYSSEGRSLPEDLFGNPAFGEIDSIRVNQNLETLQKGVHQSLARAPIALGNGENVDLTEYFARLFEFIDGQPTPINHILVDQPGDNPHFDAARAIIERTLISGNIAMQILNNLQIDAQDRFGKIVDYVPDERLNEVYLSFVGEFRTKLNQVLLRINQLKSERETDHRHSSRTHAVRFGLTG